MIRIDVNESYLHQMQLICSLSGKRTATQESLQLITIPMPVHLPDNTQPELQLLARQSLDDLACVASTWPLNRSRYYRQFSACWSCFRYDPVSFICLIHISGAMIDVSAIRRLLLVVWVIARIRFGWPILCQGLFLRCLQWKVGCHYDIVSIEMCLLQGGETIPNPVIIAVYSRLEGFIVFVLSMIVGCRGVDNVENTRVGLFAGAWRFNDG